MKGSIEMDKHKNMDRILGVILLLLGLALCIGVKTVFHACGQTDEGKWMACHWAEQAEMALGASIAVTALMRLIVRSGGKKQGLALALIPQGIAAALIPNTLIKLCMMENMRCHAVMKPASVVIAVLVAVVAAVTAFMGRDE